MEKVKTDQEKSESWVEGIYNKVTSPKTIKYFGYAALGIFFGFIISAIIVASSVGPYNMIDNWISDMGSFTYTPAPFLLDWALIITGILLIPFHFYVERYIAPIPRSPNDPRAPHRWVYRLMGIAFFFNMLGSISMTCVGIFSEDRSFGLHMPFSIGLFGSFMFSGIFMGLALMISDRKLVPGPWNYLLGAYGVHGLLIVGIFGAYNLILRTMWERLWEWLCFFALVAWILPLFFFCLHHANKQLKGE